MPTPLPDENDRLQALYDYQILDTRPEAGFDDLVELASAICETPVALVSLVDEERQWFKARKGLAAQETHRDLAFCAHALDGRPLVVEDATRDDRFSQNELVTGALGIRFYAGAPLMTSEGFALGTVCVIDFHPRQLSETQLKALQALSRQAVALLELRRSNRQLRVAADRLEQARRRAESASAAKSRFLAGMSHELRTPLNAIIGFSEVLVDQSFGPLNAKQSRYLNNIASSGRLLLGHINDLLDASQVEAGKLELDIRPVAANAALEESISVTSLLAAARELKISDQSQGRCWVAADASRLRQILFTLLSNAIKVTPQGGQIAIGCRPFEGHVEFWVQDGGPEIPPKEQDQVFMDFKQLGEREGGPDLGTCLGLALSRRLVEMQGGQLWLVSSGEGTLFRLTLPSAEPDYVPRPPTLTGSPLVLIVEDDPDAAELMEHFLSAGGYRTCLARNGLEALQMTEELRPDAMTLDLELPALDGWHVLMALREQPLTRNLPIIVVSADQDSARTHEMKADVHLVKPVQSVTLLKELANLLGAGVVER